MNLSRKNKRNLKRLRKDAAKLWAEQQAVNEHAAAVMAKARSHAIDISKKDLVPAARDAYESNLRPSLERSLKAARDAYDDARVRVGGTVMPRAAGAAGSIAGLLSQAAGSRDEFKAPAKNAKHLSKDLKKRADRAVREYNKKTGKGGLGVGGWTLIGAGVAAAAAAGYALWQTFRADDDLWIADEELDGPITTIAPKSAPAESASDVKPHHIPASGDSAVPSVAKPAN